MESGEFRQRPFGRFARHGICLLGFSFGSIRDQGSELCCPAHFRFSNRPFEVKRFQTIHHHSFNVARQGPSIMGFEEEVEQS
jgi:hypothetical protein